MRKMGIEKIIKNGPILKYFLRFFVIFLSLFNLIIDYPTVSNAQSDSDFSDKEINIYWTDTGVYMGTRPEHLKHPEQYMFKPFTFDNIESVFPSISSKGQILVPMPKNEDLPKTEEGWKLFTSKLYRGIKERINQGLKDNINNFEIRTVQNITIKGGYWSPGQQNLCVKFTKAFLEALAQIKKELLASYNFNIAGVVGSNGGYVATEAIPALKQNPIDKLIIIDGRAYKQKTVDTYNSLKGNLTIINTAGDAPALPDMIANHSVAKSLKKALPKLTVLWTDPKGGFAHIKCMNPNAVLWVKEFTGSEYTEKSKMIGRELLNSILSPIPTYRVYHDSNNPGKSMTEAQTLTETVHNKHKALIVGKGTEADLMYKNMVQKLGKENVKRIDSYTDDKALQLEARRFGADVILGVKGVGGVWIDPKPSSAGKGGSETKKKVLKSRPSEDTLYWDVK